MSDMDISYDAIRNRIFELLKNQKLSQKVFAQSLGISPQTITDWKNKKSNSYMEMLSQIATILKTTPVWLCFGDGAEYMSDNTKKQIDELNSQIAQLQCELAKRDAIQSAKNAFQNLKQRGFLSELMKDYPQLLSNFARDLGVTTSELLGESRPSTAPAGKADLQAAFWGGEKDLSQEELDAMWNDVERFAAFLAEKKRQEKKND